MRLHGVLSGLPPGWSLRLDVEHSLLPTSRSRYDFDEELVPTRQVLYRKHLGWRALRQSVWHSAKLPALGPTDSVRMPRRFSSVDKAVCQTPVHDQPLRQEFRSWYRFRK